MSRFRDMFGDAPHGAAWEDAPSKGEGAWQHVGNAAHPDDAGGVGGEARLVAAIVALLASVGAAVNLLSLQEKVLALPEAQHAAEALLHEHGGSGSERRNGRRDGGTAAMEALLTRHDALFVLRPAPWSPNARLVSLSARGAAAAQRHDDALSSAPAQRRGADAELEAAYEAQLVAYLTQWRSATIGTIGLDNRPPPGARFSCRTFIERRVPGLFFTSPAAGEQTCVRLTSDEADAKAAARAAAPAGGERRGAKPAKPGRRAHDAAAKGAAAEAAEAADAAARADAGYGAAPARAPAAAAAQRAQQRHGVEPTRMAWGAVAELRPLPPAAPSPPPPAAPPDARPPLRAPRPYAPPPQQHAPWLLQPTPYCQAPLPLPSAATPAPPLAPPPAPPPTAPNAVADGDECADARLLRELRGMPAGDAIVARMEAQGVVPADLLCLSGLPPADADEELQLLGFGEAVWRARIRAALRAAAAKEVA
jgi:hypothetical protein